MENQKYINSFHEAEVTAYDFLSLFVAIYASQKEYTFNRDSLIHFISLSKNNSKFIILLGEISLKNNGVFSYSEEFNEAIAKLKWANILYTVSPEKDATINIFEDIPIEELLKPRIKHFDEMVQFIAEFKEFEANISSTASKTNNDNNEASLNLN